LRPNFTILNLGIHPELVHQRQVPHSTAKTLVVQHCAAISATAELLFTLSSSIFFAYKLSWLVAVYLELAYTVFIHSY